MKKSLVFSIAILSISLLFSSCGEYNSVLKSTDYEMKYSYAKKYYNEKKYARSATLLEELVPIFKGLSYAEESLYLLAQSYYGQKDYQTATAYFKQYYTTYPKGEFAELSRFYAGYGLAQESPDIQLDQSITMGAIQQLHLYLEYYPQSERAKQAQEVIYELQDKLAYKELLSSRLYYNLGTYMGNNYEACVITANNALQDYPYSKYREDFIYLMISAKYELALVSVADKTQTRYRDVIDEYYGYMNEYPEGKYAKEVQKYFDYANKKIVTVY